MAMRTNQSYGMILVICNLVACRWTVQPIDIFSCKIGWPGLLMGEIEECILSMIALHLSFGRSGKWD